MSNQKLIDYLQPISQLLELHDKESETVAILQKMLFTLEKSILIPLENKDVLKWAGKNTIAREIIEMYYENKEHSLVQTLTDQTPKSLFSLFSIRGLGAKKIRILWNELGITTIEEVQKSAQENRLVGIKGFGEKLQQSILDFLNFKNNNSKKVRLNVGTSIAESLTSILSKEVKKIEISGEVLRGCEIISTICVVVCVDDFSAIFERLEDYQEFIVNKKESSPTVWRGEWRNKKYGVGVEIFSYPETIFEYKVWEKSCQEAHFSAVNARIPKIENIQILSEKEIYPKANLPYIIPEMRENMGEFEWSKHNTSDQIIEYQHIKGLLHNHSVYSDGKNTIEEMALECMKMNLEYFGIADHSKSAFYANGMYEPQIIKQHQEIDALNQKYPNFKIFKGIECDILAEGFLDFEDSVLKTMDYVVVSIHSNLTMDKEKATQRIIKAVENQYSTILGHLTGRLLLEREGYPLDFDKVLDACKRNGVCIEINANPYRLDLDWRKIYGAQEKGILLSINPDAHEILGLHDFEYGVKNARKGGLLTTSTLNTFSKEEIGDYFLTKKSGIHSF